MLTATNVAEVEMWVYFWISSVFALNSSTDLISNRLCSGSRQAMLCLSESLNSSDSFQGDSIPAPRRKIFKEYRIFVKIEGRIEVGRLHNSVCR